MVIHFIGSKSNISQEYKYYRMILDNVTKQGHSVARDWLTEAQGLVDRDPADDPVEWGKIDREDAAAISKADLVIVEATKRSFFVGYRLAQAIHQKKPILILCRDGSFPGATDLSRATDFIYAKEYNESNLHKIIKDFIDENTINVKDMRFNFFIDRPIYNYLRWAAFKTGKTKAEILRELIQKEIENKKDL